MHDIAIGRIYQAEPCGHRVLVDRLWPRGVERAHAPFDEWIPEAAPTTTLRRWYGHDSERHAQFLGRYRAELDAEADGPALTLLLAMGAAGSLVLVTAARDLPMSHVPILRDWLLHR